MRPYPSTLCGGGALELEGTPVGRQLFALLLEPRFGRVITTDRSDATLRTLEEPGPFDVVVEDLDVAAEGAFDVSAEVVRVQAPGCSVLPGVAVRFLGLDARGAERLGRLRARGEATR